MKFSPYQETPFQYVKTTLVEVPIPTIGTTLPQFKFPTQDFLRNKKIVSIQSFDINSMPIAPTSGYANITQANALNCFLTLYGQNPEPVDADGIPGGGDGQWLTQIPFVTMNNIQSTATDPYTQFPFLLVPRVIIWEKSYIQLATGTTLGNAAPVAFVFQVGYIGNGGDN